MYRQTGKRHPDLDSVRIPEGVEYLYSMFWDLVGERITYAELMAYCSARYLQLNQFEVDAITAMDKEYQSFVAERIKAAQNGGH